MTNQGHNDGFYEGLASSSPEYENALNQRQTSPADAEARAVQEQEWRAELAKLEEEIATLKSVLDAKVREASELKRKLGITSMGELKDDFKHGIQSIKESEPYQKTNEKLHQLGDAISGSDTYQKTNAAFKSFGAYASRKFGDLRNSTVFKSVEEKVGGAYSTVRDQFSSKDEVDEGGNYNGFEDALRTDARSQPTESSWKSPQTSS